MEVTLVPDVTPVRPITYQHAPVLSDHESMNLFLRSQDAPPPHSAQEGQRSTTAACASGVQGLVFPPVLLVTPWYGKNGVGLVVEGVARAIRGMGGTCVVLQIRGDGWLPRLRHGDDNELIVSLCARTVSKDSTYRRRVAALVRKSVATLTVRYLVRRYELQVAHFHYSAPEYDLLSRVSVDAGLQCVATFHGSDLVVSMTEKPTRDATTAMLQRCRVVTTVSQALNQTLQGLFPRVASIARTVHNAVPATFMHSIPTIVAKTRDIDVLFVGSLTSGKGVDVLIRAIKYLSDATPSLRAVIVGDGPQRGSLVDLARDLRLEHVVDFVGWKDRGELSSLYCSARTLAVPSRAEAFGLVVVEAQICGAVVVASAVGGIPEIITDDKTGFLVPPDDPAALALAITRVLNHEATRKRIAAAARENVLERFSPACMASGYHAVYLTAALPPSNEAVGEEQEW